MAKKIYDNDFVSVTQVLDVLRKIGLEMWFKMNTPQEIAALSKKALSIGSDTHEAIDTYIKTGEIKVDTEYPEQVTTALRSFVLFRTEHPEFNLTLSEAPLTSIKHQFNGTIDCACPPYLFDWKSTEKKDKKELPIWDEWITQTATYASLWNEMMPEQITTAYVVALAKDCIEYRLYKIEADEIKDRFENIFLHALAIKNYSKNHKKEKKDVKLG
jgi:hypothetical protein